MSYKTEVIKKAYQIGIEAHNSGIIYPYDDIKLIELLEWYTDCEFSEFCILDVWVNAWLQERRTYRYNFLK